ncbi:hypothetical protein ATCV1_z263R [Acanthocystis turfacea chlorella virus 1]|uniref:Uncharacterized protein z263R n=1 Tax=Chlorovirus heliozoae TaxID=322019 RepID=A7K8M3_9PHYC|nr:hypothetical protein ATCV1_z263R [Acanthocystis turfacea chlorella virus 1]ABT16397.1 hypothetical protein ATCV1_z263R [Acanthocystis turfacea chlorella virus 1]
MMSTEPEAFLTTSDVVGSIDVAYFPMSSASPSAFDRPRTPEPLKPRKLANVTNEYVLMRLLIGLIFAGTLHHSFRARSAVMLFPS